PVSAAMDSALPAEEEAIKNLLEMKEEEQEVVNVVANLTLVSSACDMVSTAYVSTKESHPYIRSVCEAAEQGVKSMTEAITSCVLPFFLSPFFPAVAVANEYASKGVDKLGEGYAFLGWGGEELVFTRMNRNTSGSFEKQV
uniref:Uncharacterized protein n=1 Tax=Nothoprocta perdicaria TaxID=30464 RepID=A0A8C6ZLX6_NOTPE